MRTAKWLAIIAAIILGIGGGSPVFAYYYYLHYGSRTAPFNALPERFDLNALPNKTVTFFVSDNGPVQYSTNDSFWSVLSQVRQATRAWNGVDTSDLRVA